MAKWTFTLYGSDVDESTDFPLKTTITAKTDIKSWSFSALGAFPDIAIEGEATEYMNNFIEGKKLCRVRFNPKTTRITYPSTSTSVETFFPVDVLNKQFHWLDFDSNYNLKPASMTSGKVTAVAVMGAQVESQKGAKVLTFELHRREVG